MAPSSPQKYVCDAGPFKGDVFRVPPHVEHYAVYDGEGLLPFFLEDDTPPPVRCTLLGRYLVGRGGDRGRLIWTPER